MSGARQLLVMAGWLLFGAGALSQPPLLTRTLALDQLRSGLTFSGPDVQSLQADAFANPGLLWLARGESLWSQRVGPQNLSCQDCHGLKTGSMQGVAVQYPKLPTGSGSLINLEDQIRACRTQRQGVSDWGFESDGLLAMTLYVAEASKGLPLRLAIRRTGATAELDLGDDGRFWPTDEALARCKALSHDGRAAIVYEAG